MYKYIKRSKHHASDEDAEAVANQVLFGEHKTEEKVKEFEKEMSEFIGVKYAKATSSGTTALHLSLLSLGVSKNDEVILPSYVCQSLLNAVNYTGAKPILADIDFKFETKGFNISDKTIKPLITNKTKTIILPHMFGVPADIKQIQKFGIPIIEDCAHSLGAKYNGKMLGNLGDVSIFSFYATKMISTGQGGMILSSSRRIKERLDDLTQYDGRDNYKVAYNYDLTDIQAALGISQLHQLPFFLQRRNEIAEKYDKAFSKTSLHLSPRINGEIPYRYIVRTNSLSEKKTLEKKLKGAGIMAEKPIFKPLHKYLNLNSEDFPNTEYIQDTALTIPLYPALTDKEVNYIASTVVKYLK